MSEEPYCCECSQLKPGATPLDIMYAHEGRLTDGFNFYGGGEVVEHVVGLMLRADKERMKRLEAALQSMVALLEEIGRCATAVPQTPRWTFENLSLSTAQILADARAALKEGP